MTCDNIHVTNEKAFRTVQYNRTNNKGIILAITLYRL